MNFHNTIDLSGHELAKAKQVASSQNDTIKRFFMRDYRISKEVRRHSPSSVWKTLIFLGEINKSTPLTSIRRSMTNLASDKHFRFLIKTQHKKTGPSGKPEYTWIINVDHINNEQI